MNGNESSGFTGGQMVVALLGGAAVGAGIALLTAPRSGAETRAELKAMAQTTRNRAASLPHALAGAAEAGSDAFTGALAQSAKIAKHNGHA